MAYLNGIHLSLHTRTLVVRIISVIMSTSGGLAAGKEGPMVHAGAIIGAQVARGKTSPLNHDISFYKYFRDDRIKRDFVAAGAAAGVTAAFAAPIGGVLFGMEGCASFLNQRLAWQMLFGNVITTFVLHALLSVYYGHYDMSHNGLLNLGKFDELKYTVAELPVFVLVGVIGGVLGALYNQITLYLRLVRSWTSLKKWVKIIDACIIAVLSALVRFVSIYYVNDCKLRSIYDDESSDAINTEGILLTQMFCNDDEYNPLAGIWFQTPQSMLRSILHESHEALGVISVVVFGLCFYFLACVTYGVSVSMGLFVPSLVIGATWGRLVGVLVGQYVYNDMSWQYFGKYALLGAVAQLSGVVRLTLSLAVIMMESTGNADMGIPLIITVVVARWTGDQFNDNVYNNHLQVSHVPFLDEFPPPLSTNIKASQVMNSPAVSFRTVENVGTIVDVLRATKHSGFPVKGPLTAGGRGRETFRGVILRSQLITLIESKSYETSPSERRMTLDAFRYKFSHYTDIAFLPVSDDDRRSDINLVPYMNNSPYTVYETTSLPRTYILFRGLGLRHLVVVTDQNEVAGMITRVNLARYRTWNKYCRVGVVEIPVILRRNV